MENKKFVDTAAVATYTGMKSGTFEKMRVCGDGPKYYKIGKAVRYRLEDVDEWLAARCAGNTGDYKCYGGPGRPRKTAEVSNRV